MKIARIIRLYKMPNGKEPFAEWAVSLAREHKERVAQRIDRVSQSNFGDHKYIGEGIHELRLTFGPGFRIYYGIDGTKLSYYYVVVIKVLKAKI